MLIFIVQRIASRRFWPGLLFLLFSCNRLVQPPVPDTISADAHYDRRNRLWLVSDAVAQRAFYADGKAAYVADIENGDRNGSFTSYAPDGKTITTKGHYEHGRRAGIWNHYDDSGLPYVTIRYTLTPADPLLSAVSREIGNENGNFTRYYANGKTELTGSYKAGHFDGMFRRLSRTGQLQWQGLYTEGLKQGRWVYYDVQGGFLREETYVSGKLTGLFRLYRNGNLYFETMYQDNVEVGPRRYFDNER